MIYWRVRSNPGKGSPALLHFSRHSNGHLAAEGQDTRSLQKFVAPKWTIVSLPRKKHPHRHFVFLHVKDTYQIEKMLKTTSSIDQYLNQYLSLAWGIRVKIHLSFFHCLHANLFNITKPQVVPVFFKSFVCICFSSVLEWKAHGLRGQIGTCFKSQVCRVLLDPWTFASSY